MGLDVKVFQNIKPVDNESQSKFQAYVIDEKWEWKIKNLIKDQYYTGDMVAHEISYPYSAHSRFREELVKFIGMEYLLDREGQIKWEELPEDMPFIDLINFADNDGCLDFEVSKKIYNDFAEWLPMASINLTPYYESLYLNWMETFNLGKDNGVVVFH